jgi:hypothetical protein
MHVLRFQQKKAEYAEKSIFSFAVRRRQMKTIRPAYGEIKAVRQDLQDYEA